MRIRLTDKDKLVIANFIMKTNYKSKKLMTDGISLDGMWMGGSDIAYWDVGFIVIKDLGSKSAEVVQRYLKKFAKTQNIKVISEYDKPKAKSSVKSKEMQLYNLLEDYYRLLGSNKTPNKNYIRECADLDMLDEEIRRVEEKIMDVEFS